MKNGVEIISKPEWIKKLQRNAKARKRYYEKRYGSLARMEAIDKRLQDEMDEWSAEDEMKNCQ